MKQSKLLTIHKIIQNLGTPKGGYHLKKKKKVMNFHNFGPDPPPKKKSCEIPNLFFFTP